MMSETWFCLGVFSECVSEICVHEKKHGFAWVCLVNVFLKFVCTRPVEISGDVVILLLF